MFRPFFLPIHAAALVALATHPALAADPTPSGRYQIVKSSETTAWRLDSQTGEIVACRFNGSEMVCGSTETAIRRGKTDFQEYKAEKRSDEKARREDDLAFLERVMEMFKSFVAFFKEQERANDQQTRRVSADCDCKCP